MTYDLEQAGGSIVLSVNGECTIEHAASLKDVLQEAMQAGTSVLLKLAGVTAVDASFLQLLCAAHRRMLQLDRPMTIDPCWPAALTEAAAATGYYRTVGCHKDPAKTCLWQGEHVA